jgi:YHS domain-containing protein
MITRRTLAISVLCATLTLLAGACTSSKSNATQGSAQPATAQSQPGSEPRTAFDAPPSEGTKAKCPVSGETFTVGANTQRSEYQSKHYVFCCPDCKPDFDKDPAKYTQGTAPEHHPHGS